jgi:hypothetical protein
MTLKGRAKGIDTGCVVAQRLKRLSSIRLKLVLIPGMQMSRMHDIGGCRAVVRSIAEERKIVGLYRESAAKNPHDRPEFVKAYDYIAKPKPDGYRSVHMVYKYRTGSKHRSVYNGHRIEIQIRSRLQHVWATAVEVASTFTGEALKSNVGDVHWRRFFALIGNVIAQREKCPAVPAMPAPVELKAEVIELSKRLKIAQSFEGWGVAAQDIVKHAKDAQSFLLELDPAETPPRIEVKGYLAEQMKQASEDYLTAEKRAVGTDRQVVLVSVDSVASLRRAYPNYYLDTTSFLAELRRASA